MDAATSVGIFGVQMSMDRVWLSRNVIIGHDTQGYVVEDVWASPLLFGRPCLFGSTHRFSGRLARFKRRNGFKKHGNLT